MKIPNTNRHVTKKGVVKRNPKKILQYEVVGVYLGDTIFSEQCYTRAEADKIAKKIISKMQEKEEVSDAFVEIRAMIDGGDDIDSVMNWYPDDIWDGVKYTIWFDEEFELDNGKEYTKLKDAIRDAKTRNFADYNQVYISGSDGTLHWLKGKRSFE